MATIEKRVFSGGFANALLFVFSFVQSIALVPVFLSHWGKEKYGIWIALYAFFTLMKTFDLGHQSYIGNELNKFYYLNKNKAKELLSSSLKIAYFIGLLELIFGAVLLLFFGGFFWGINRNEEQFNHAFIGMISLLAMWMLIGSVGGIWARLLIATGDFARATYWGILYKVLETAVLLIAVFENFSILVTCIILSVTTLLYSHICILDIKRQNPEFYPLKKSGALKIGWINFQKSIFITLSGFMDQMGNNLQIVGVTTYIGQGVVPSFTTVRTITNVAIQVLSIFTGPVTIDVIRYFVTKESKKLAELFSLIWLSSSIFIYIPFVILTPFIEKIFAAWTNNLLVFNYYLFYLLSYTVCVISFGSPFKILLTGTNHLKALIILSGVRLFILCLIPVGIKTLGLTMIGIAVLCSELFSSVLLPYLFIKRQLLAINMVLSKKSILVSIMPLVLVGLFFLVCGLRLFTQKNLVFVSLIIVVLLMMLLVIQWKNLNKHSKDKITQKIYSRLPGNARV